MCGICGCNSEVEKTKYSHSEGSNIVGHNHHDEDISELLQIEQDVLAKNNAFAELNRQFFLKNNIIALNIVSSPGSGKTTLLVNTIETLKNQISLAVIEGDQHTQLDADRIRQTQTPVIQVNTGKVCHLDAHQIGHALEELNPQPRSILFIENVGNLICPALFDLGELKRVAVLSVTEGDDKPLKYPDIFSHADVMLINKIDLLPYVTFDIEKCIDYAKRINPKIEIIMTSAITQSGVKEWCDWIFNISSQK